MKEIIILVTRLFLHTIKTLNENHNITDKAIYI
jgi:hypothetical protein